MITLKLPTHKLRVVLGESAHTELGCYAGFKEWGSGIKNVNDTSIFLTTGTTPKDFVTAPTITNTQRDINTILIPNTDNIPHLIKILFNVDGTDYVMHQELIPAGKTFGYEDKKGFFISPQPVGGGSFSGTMDDIEDGITYVKTENNYTDGEKSKLSVIEEEAVALTTVKDDTDIHDALVLRHSNSLDHDGPAQDTAIAGKTTLTAVKADTDIASAISLKHSNSLDHSHSNKTLLDAYTQDEVDIKDAVTKKHSNSLDHSHSNKSTLDTYTQTEVNLADAVSKKHANTLDHSHTNKATLDSIQEALTTALKGNYDTAYTHSQSAHAPSNAQKNSDITKEEIEAKLTGVISTHSHSGSSPAGVLDDLQISVLQSDGTLNAALGVQTWCGTNKTGQDVFTVAANTTYSFKGQWIVNTGATTHTTAMAWSLSGATVASFEYLVNLWSAALNAIATTQSTIHVSGVASKVLNATSTAVYTIINFEGTLVTGTGGTITPQINFSANPTGTNLMKRGSWVSFSKLGADTFTQNGGWA